MRLSEFSWLLEGLYGVASAIALAVPSMMATLGDRRVGVAAPTVEPPLEEELRALERQQAAVAELGRRGFETTDLSLLMEEATALVAETLGVEYVKVLELLPGGRELLLRGGAGWRDGLVGRTTVGADVDSQAGFTLLCREPVIVEDLAREDRFSDLALLRDHGVVSGLSVLVQGDGKPYGVLGAHTTRRRVFTRDDVHFLQAVANVLGAAIQRQRADETLQQREESYRSLYLAVSGGIVVQNRDGVITEANETACEILGLTRREIQGRTSTDPRWRTLRADGSPFPGEEHPAMVTLRTGRSVRDVVMGVLHSRTGEYRWILVNSEPITDQATGIVRAVVATFADITEQKRAAEDNARLYQQAQRAVRVRDDFLSVAAHELRTPVTSLQGFAQLAMKELKREGGPDPSRMHQALQVIDYQSKKLAHLVSQLLDVSRMETGRLLVERQRVDLTQLVKRVVAVAGMTTNGHTLEVRAPRSLPAMVDPSRMEQVITNLVDNAIKYSPEGGPVEIELSMACPQTVRLAVRDHGIGIPLERRDRIFDRLYRAHPVKHFSGLGLGLYLVREVVSLHGGVIEVDSPPDGGTLFVVTLPRGLDLSLTTEAEAA